MDWLSPTAAGWLADLVLASHVGIVLFVVFGQVGIVAGGMRGWAWVRSFRIRVVHLALMLVIVAQAWLGRLCPLTIWEQALRTHAGQGAYDGSFIEHWLSRLIFFEAPWWVFVLAYTLFALAVAGSWIAFPPRRQSART